MNKAVYIIVAVCHYVAAYNVCTINTKYIIFFAHSFAPIDVYKEKK